MSLFECWKERSISPRTLLAVGIAMAVWSLKKSWSPTPNPRSFFMHPAARKNVRSPSLAVHSVLVFDFLLPSLTRSFSVNGNTAPNNQAAAANPGHPELYLCPQMSHCERSALGHQQNGSLYLQAHTEDHWCIYTANIIGSRTVLCSMPLVTSAHAYFCFAINDDLLAFIVEKNPTPLNHPTP